MPPRLDNPSALFSAGFKAMVALEQALAHTIDPELLEFVKLRASQINGCAFCIYMHTTDLRKRGVDGMKLYLLNAWRDTFLYSDRERAALGWTETLTRVAHDGASDEAYEALATQFNEEERVQLTLAIGAINVWNRLQVGFRVAHPPRGAVMRADAA